MAFDAFFLSAVLAEEALLEEPPHAARLRARPAARNTESTFFMF